MRKVRALIGQPVVVNHRRIGRVVQVELNSELTELTGLWVDEGILGTRFIPSESLAMLGKVAVMADERGKRKRCKSPALFRRAVGTDGSRLGAITGAEIDELSFRVNALELSFGLWEDLLIGRRAIRQFTLNRETGDVLIDTAESEKEEDHHEKRNDQGTDHRRGDRRLGGDDVRRHELAVCPADEPADEKDRPVDRQQDG